MTCSGLAHQGRAKPCEHIIVVRLEERPCTSKVGRYGFYCSLCGVHDDVSLLPRQA
jgi:hypothetical protein